MKACSACGAFKAPDQYHKGASSRCASCTRAYNRSRNESRKPVERGKLYRFRGLELDLPLWAEESGIPYNTLYARVSRGWSLEDALGTPVGERRSPLLTSEQKKAKRATYQKANREKINAYQRRRYAKRSPLQPPKA